MNEKNQEIINSIVFSVFDDDGPSPKVYFPPSMDESARLLIAMKTISILMGDAIYQNGTHTEGINYFGILPFPDLQLNGLTYFFLIPDVNARGNAKAATITVLIDEANNIFFYENMKYLRVIIDKAASKIQDSVSSDDYRGIITELQEELCDFTSDIKDPLSFKRQIKILFTGLDQAGKTSFLLGVKKRYSEIIKTLPTKGIARTEEKIFEEQNSQISIWDLGGQKKYRDRFLEQSKMYLYNIDLLFYFIDIQDSLRVQESLSLFKQVVQGLRELGEFPPLIIILNKMDPDLKDSKEIRKNIKIVSSIINKSTENYFMKIFKTSIFDHWSLITAYSFGLSQLSPNRELFENQLMQLAKKTKSESILLLNEKGIILSSYSQSEISEKVFSISAPHFQTLYRTFKEFKLLKKDFLVSSGIADESKIILFKKIDVGKYMLYLLIFLQKDLELKMIDKALVPFIKNVSELIETYI